MHEVTNLYRLSPCCKKPMDLHRNGVHFPVFGRVIRGGIVKLAGLEMDVKTRDFSTEVLLNGRETHK